jgi:thiosulfate/3-mercaptopyruvate sulfurtransferase
MIATVPTTFVRPDYLASPVWVAENHGRPGVRVVDCRWRVDGSGRRLHAEGHIPGSVYIDWATELVDTADPLPFQLAAVEQFASAMVRAGIGDGMTVVVCDDTYSLYASRVWWSMRTYGIEGVRVLDGGWQAWLDSGSAVSTAPTSVEAVVFTPHEQAQRRVSTDEMIELVRSRVALVVDARTPAEYHGQSGSEPRRGHIPGAVNLPVALLARQTGQEFPDAETLSRLVARNGVEAGRRLVTYDATGIGAAKLALALELLGFDDVALYDTGWPGWAAGSDEDQPVEV